ncbi:hypothetical protein GmHk_05G014218 [Glycine max]|nr:hypothetical protein GmHk_05G014218 [Glycine max]
MILGPGFIPPTQLLFSIPFSFFLSIFISFLHALMVRLSLAFIFLSICTHNNNNNKKVLFTGQNFQLTGGNLVFEMTVMSVEGMHSLDAEVADAYTCEREMK